MALFDRFKKKPIRKIIGGDTPSEVGLQTVNWEQLGGTSYNPDEVSIQTYKSMMKDSTVRAGYNLVKFSVLSRNWKIIYPEKEKKALEIVDYLKYSFENMDGRLSGALSNVLTSLLYGFSVSEIVFDIFKQGKYKSKIGVKKVKTLDPETIKFITDKKGTLKKVKQTSTEIGLKDINLPIDRLIIHTNEKEFGNYYGVSRLRAVYEHWFIKKVITRFWNVSLERFGTPIVIGSVPSKHDLNTMKGILSNLQSKSSLAKLGDWEIEALETGIGRSSGGDFKGCIEHHDTQILRGMLIPNSLLGGGSGGSFAKSKVEFDLFLLMIRSLEQDICGIIENYLIKPLVYYNYGEMQSFPQFVFEPMTKEEFLELAKVFALLVRNGVIGADETWMRDMMRVPKREETAITGDQAKATSGEETPPKPPVEEKKLTIKKDESSSAVKKPAPVKKPTPVKKKPITGPTQQIKVPKQRAQSV